MNKDNFPDYMINDSVSINDSNDLGWIHGSSDYFLDSQHLLNPQEIRSIDENVRKVIYRSAVAQKFISTKQVPRGNREHRISIAKASSSPIFSLDFLPESMDKVAKKETIHYLTGISKDYFLSMVDIDASRNSDYHRDKIDSLHLREMTALISDFKERMIWRGSDIRDPNPENINPLAKGILTTAGINSFTKTTLGTAGDGVDMISQAYNSLLKENFDPPFTCVLNPYILGQLALNYNATNGKSDIERMREMVDANGMKMVSKFYVSDHLTVLQDDGQASSCVFIAPKNNAGEDTVLILESYPQWHYPITNNKLGIQGKVLWMGGVAVVRPLAVCLEEGIDIDG